MGRPYSMDIRERVVLAVEQGGMSRHQAAAHFGVAASTAINWVGRFRRTGSAAPGQMGGQESGKIVGLVLVVTRRDAPKMFDLVEEALDDVARLVGKRAEADGVFAVCLGGMLAHASCCKPGLQRYRCPGRKLGASAFGERP